jgi:hypothetical protein
MRAHEPKFSWRGVVLIAIGFAMIGLAVLFRSGGSQPVTVSSIPAVRTSPDLRPLLEGLGFGVLLVVSMALGVWFGYLHLLRRSQQQPRREHESDLHKKT